MRQNAFTHIIRDYLRQCPEVKYFTIKDFFEVLDGRKVPYQRVSVRSQVPRIGMVEPTPFCVFHDVVRYSRIYCRTGHGYSEKEIRDIFTEGEVKEVIGKGFSKVPKKPRVENAKPDKQAFKRAVPLPSMAKAKKVEPRPDFEPNLAETEPCQSVKIADGELSAYQFGSLIMQYIEELKTVIRQKDLEMKTVLRNAMDEEQKLIERNKELEKQLSKANQTIITLNETHEKMQHRLEICQKTVPNNSKTFKLGEVAHILVKKGEKACQ